MLATTKTFELEQRASKAVMFAMHWRTWKDTYDMDRALAAALLALELQPTISDYDLARTAIRAASPGKRRRKR
jgi:hypothetical protein